MLNENRWPHDGAKTAASTDSNVPPNANHEAETICSRAVLEFAWSTLGLPRFSLTFSLAVAWCESSDEDAPLLSDVLVSSRWEEPALSDESFESEFSVGVAFLAFLSAWRSASTTCRST